MLSAVHSSRAQSLSIGVALVPGIVASVWYLASAYRSSGALGFPLDDSWIHAQFARNLATGHGFTYTGSDWVAGSTAPAWTVLLAAGYFVLRNIVSAAVVWGTLLQATAGYYAFRLTQLLDVPRGVSLLAGTLVALAPVITWGAVAGMEVNLAAALVLAGLYYHFADRRSGRQSVRGAALLGTSVLARPENLALVAIVLLGEWIATESLGLRARRFARAAVVAGAVSALLVIFSYLTIGRPLPTTFYAKSGPGIVRAIETRDAGMIERNLQTFGPQAVQNMWLILRDQFSWGAFVAAAGAAVLLVRRTHLRVSLTLIAVLVAVPFAMGLTAPQRLKVDNVRYAGQLVVLAAPLLVAGVWHTFRAWPLPALIVAAVCATVAWQTVERARPYALAVKNIQELHVRTGRWIAENLPPGAVVAVNDVGAIAYFGRRRILDLEGLVSPEVLPYRNLPDRGQQVVRAMRPDYLVIFPGWYPDLSNDPAFQEIHRVSIADNIISAGDTLVVYRAPWTPER